MSDFNSQHNRVVWCDIPVVDLDRAAAFYTAVLGVPVHLERFENFSMGVLHHQDGNGGCLVVKQGEAPSATGVLIYMNAEGRIRDAVTQAKKHGGQVIEDTHSIGPHGFRAILLDSEGNRIALHSNTDK